MNILQAHNFYRQAGGEDQVVAAENELLTRHGHSVAKYTVHNDEIAGLSAVSLAAKTVWNQTACREVRALIRRDAITLLHVHNTLPLLSPAIYYAAEAEKIPVVQTLHNYRLACPAATLFRDGAICEKCLCKSIKLPAVRHRCYRASLPASAASAAMLAFHHLAGTYRTKVHRYIALTEFGRRKFETAGLPPERVAVKPNFLSRDPGPGAGKGGFALFAGRLVAEKGVAPMLAAWQSNARAIPLKIMGDGPLRDTIQPAGNVEYLGSTDHSRLLAVLQQAEFLILPSLWYEGLPMIAIEAMACGTPVVAFNVGSLNDIVEENKNGLLLPPAELGNWLANYGQFQQQFRALRGTTRNYFETHFTAERNYAMLIDIYRSAVNLRHSLS